MAAVCFYDSKNISVLLETEFNGSITSFPSSLKSMDIIPPYPPCCLVHEALRLVEVFILCVFAYSAAFNYRLGAVIENVLNILQISISIDADELNPEPGGTSDVTTALKPPVFRPFY